MASPPFAMNLLTFLPLSSTSIISSASFSLRSGAEAAESAAAAVSMVSAAVAAAVAAGAEAGAADSMVDADAAAGDNFFAVAADSWFCKLKFIFSILI